MSNLQDILKKHLLLGALLLSAGLHLAVIFWVTPKPITQSSLGNNQLILLEPSITPTPAVNTKKKATESAPIEKKQQKGKAQPSLTGKTKKVEQALPLAKTLQPQKEAQVSEEKTKNTNNTGEQLDQSGKELSTEDKYKGLVLNHLLKNSQSAPTHGSAKIHLTIIRAGIATQIKIELKQGSESYKAWLQRQVLSANPFPPMPKELPAQQHSLSFGISHEPN